ncbi:hypothetical protein [Francisella sp. 19X1-34]|uniref:hypothetical protein n=1 Tax=Francisella sp. 19X1-34 TaxID=3087177 RepID=UPI002E31D924|nr:hypothetical protein [Francisella sp. 19X1-34]MED7789493.1 hypothetical protein [Francisella sp. 19X1-34]
MKNKYIKLLCLAFASFPLMANALQSNIKTTQPQDSSSYNVGKQLGNAVSDGQTTMQKYYQKSSNAVKSAASDTKKGTYQLADNISSKSNKAEVAMTNQAHESAAYIGKVSKNIQQDFSNASKDVVNSSDNAKKSIINKANQASESLNKTATDTKNKIKSFKKGFDDGKKSESKPAPF